MILSIPSSAKLVQASMCQELYLLILNPLSLMKSEPGLTGNFFILSNLFLARKMLLITLPGDIIQVYKKEEFAMHSYLSISFSLLTLKIAALVFKYCSGKGNCRAMP